MGNAVTFYVLLGLIFAVFLIAVMGANRRRRPVVTATTPNDRLTTVQPVTGVSLGSWVSFPFAEETRRGQVEEIRGGRALIRTAACGEKELVWRKLHEISPI